MAGHVPLECFRHELEIPTLWPLTLYVQDFLAYLPFKKSHPSPSMHAALKDLKYVLTGISLVVAMLVGFRRSDDPTSTPAGVRSFFSLNRASMLTFSLVVF